MALTTYYPTPGTASGPNLAPITNGFVLTDDVTMQETKQLATTFAARKVSPQVTWRDVLNNTTSTRPKSCGDKTIDSLKSLLVYHRVSVLQANPALLFAPGSARALETYRCLDDCASEWWCAILPIPNSFAMGDGRALKVAAAAAEQTEAMQKACLMAFTILMLRGPTLVLLRANHWANNEVTPLQNAAVTMSGVPWPASGTNTAVQVAPAPPPRSRRVLAYYEPPADGAQQERNDLIAEILSELIRRSSTGWVMPSRIPRGGWRMLRQYVPPGGLPQFIREHNWFQMRQLTQTTWEFGFAEERHSDTGGMLVPVSDSATSEPDEIVFTRVLAPGGDDDDTSLLDLAELELFIQWASDDGRKITRHQCEHGEWLTRAPRLLTDSHVLAAHDLETAPAGSLAQKLPPCCQLRPREERYDVPRKQWQVWDYVDGFIDEDIFYQFEGLD